ncbi:DUF4124 domain-containing protein [Pleionea sp. CnH1-48]|uniref:DUF4124 domain-containing protein n=1 Tax=Pleionea sp. CnH1-48 TaxID=2954494 RepID=UPI0020975595|nr:DUF4124 domain-containing protein [Pleionea sp. CnH1-48]MCO7227193.1 DUF4124 domain-containing protein [Pleionea sp. CnH1-48]
MNIKVLSLVMMAWCSSCLAGELYQWRDEQGRLHYSDKPPLNKKVQKVEVKEVQTMNWKSSPELEKLPRQKAAKGKSQRTKKKVRCDRLKKKTDYYERKSRQNLDSDYYRKKKREYRWQKQKSC